MVKIKSIKKLKPELTVDIEVEDTHTYQLSNGMISHNTVSQLVNAASGMHERFSEYYIRTVRADSKDPLAQFMVQKEFPWEYDIMDKSNNTLVFSFPIKTPETDNNTSTNRSRTAIEQLNHWLYFQVNWCEHKPSMTVYVKENEWFEVGAWVWENFDKISGISFLPYSDHIYKQAPYQEITESEYEKMKETFPSEINWSQLAEFEKDDTTIGIQEFACSGNETCEVVDLV